MQKKENVRHLYYDEENSRTGNPASCCRNRKYMRVLCVCTGKFPIIANSCVHVVGVARFAVLGLQLREEFLVLPSSQIDKLDANAIT